MILILEVDETEAEHIKDCLEVSSDANGGNMELTPNGETWDHFTDRLLKHVSLAIEEATNWKVGKTSQIRLLICAALLTVSSHAPQVSSAEKTELLNLIKKIQGD